MMLIRSMEDLARARENALERQDDLAKTKPYHIRVSLASCGIAAGAADTLDALDHLVTSGNISGVSPDVIRISKIGCLGLCALEPIVQVEIANQPLVTYGKVTPTVAERILRDHIGKGIVVQDYVVEIF